MNILYFIEPYYEFDNPSFRIPTIKHIILPHIEKINILDKKHKFSIISSKETLSLCKNILPDFIETYDIDISNYKKLYKSSIDYACSTYKNKNLDKVTTIANNIRKHIQFNPDIVILYESASEQLVKLLFPHSKILHMMFGPFSRAPFPATTFFSTQGIYKNSELYNIQERELTYEEKETIRKIRKRAMLCIAETTPIKQKIAHLRSKYDNLVLVCCQVDNYFAFNACTTLTNQYDLILTVLNNIPSNFGVVVTTHGEFKKQLNAQQEFTLSKFSNFELIDTNIPYVSQFFMPYVDGVVTVSSSLGFQAALWQKPLIVPGESHISALAIGKKINDIIPYMTGEKNYDKSSILLDILENYTFFDKEDLSEGNKLIKIYEKCIAGKQLLRKRTHLEILDCFKKYFRGLELKNILIKKNIKITPDYIRIAISKAAIVSFDVFDTLIVRPFAEPWHLFFAVEEKARNILGDSFFNFVYFRRMAEADMRRISGSGVEITIEEIYTRIKELTGIPQKDIDTIMQYEIECELFYCKASRIFSKEYNFTKLLCNRISIISDIYLHTSTIKELLAKAGYSDYDLLLVSADTKVRKHDGSLYKQYIHHAMEQWHTLPEHCLHIGDNPIADLEMPRKYGIKSYCFPRGIQNYSKSFISNYLSSNIQRTNISGSFISGLISARWYNDSFNKIYTDSAFNGDAFMFGYCAAGPLILGFIQWLHLRAQIQGNNHLYFLARDGWILREAYNIFFRDKAIDNTYLYCSRRSASIPSISTLNDIFEIAFRSFDARSIKDLLETRFGISQNEIPKEILKECSLTLDDIVTPLRNQSNLRKFFEKIQNIIFSHALEERQLFISYCNSLGLDKHIKLGRPAFIDIGYSGSMQKYLSKLYNSNSIDGYYFLSHFFSRYDHGKSLCDGYLACYDDHKIDNRHKLNNNVFLFESILSSPEGSFVRFKKDNDSINYVFLYDTNENQRVSFLNHIHSGCLAFIKDAASYGDTYRGTFDLPNRIAEKILLEFADKPKKLDASIFISVGVENLYGGGSVNLIEQSFNTNISDDELAGLIKRSKWHAGAMAYYNSDKKLEKAMGKQSHLEITTITRKQRLHNKLDRTPELFFKDSKNYSVRLLGELVQKLTPNSLLRKKIIQYAHYIIGK